MKHVKLDTMLKGWFVGQFSPAAFKTDSCEVAVKRYKKGDSEVAHFHKIATEITLVLSGSVKMFNKQWTEGDIIVIEPNEATSFEALTDVITVVVKIPGVMDDKYCATQNVPNSTHHKGS